MKPIIIVGAITITLSLVLYSVGLIRILRHKTLTRSNLKILTIGLGSEVIAVVCMLIGTTKSVFTLHGIIGYIGLGLMITVVVKGWKLLSHNESSIDITKSLLSFYKIVYIFWIIAYVSGVLISMNR